MLIEPDLPSYETNGHPYKNTIAVCPNWSDQYMNIDKRIIINYLDSISEAFRESRRKLAFRARAIAMLCIEKCQLSLFSIISLVIYDLL